MEDDEDGDGGWRMMEWMSDSDVCAFIRFNKTCELSLGPVRVP